MDLTRRPAAERVAGTLADAGLTRLHARVFGALLLDPDGRMTSAELGEFLDASAAGISGAVATLTQVGLIRRERAAGSRRDVYVVDDDAWHGTFMAHDQTYRPLRTALGAALDSLSADDSAADRIFLAREYLLFLGSELDALAERWEVHKRELLEERAER